jgi:hypothetical protein
MSCCALADVLAKQARHAKVKRLSTGVDFMVTFWWFYKVGVALHALKNMRTGRHCEARF